MTTSLQPSSLSVAAAKASELTEILALLKACDLPCEGVAEHLGGFLVAREEGALLGVVALERYGEVGLLRSLAVRPDARGKGLGAMLVEALMDKAGKKDISVLYLLTETAPNFFPRFGFEPIPRESLAARLEASAELRGVCPETAVAMRRKL